MSSKDCHDRNSAADPCHWSRPSLDHQKEEHWFHSLRQEVLIDGASRRQEV